MEKEISQFAQAALQQVLPQYSEVEASNNSGKILIKAWAHGADKTTKPALKIVIDGNPEVTKSLAKNLLRISLSGTISETSGESELHYTEILDDASETTRTATAKNMMVIVLGVEFPQRRADLEKWFKTQKQKQSTIKLVA